MRSLCVRCHVSLPVVGAPDFCRDQTAPLSPSGSCSRCPHTAGTRRTAALPEARLHAAGTHLSEQGVKSQGTRSLPRNRSRSVWTWGSVSGAGWSAAAGLERARLSVSSCERCRCAQRRPCLSWSRSTDRPPVRWLSITEAECVSWMWRGLSSGDVSFPGSPPLPQLTFLQSPRQPRLNQELITLSHML